MKVYMACPAPPHSRKGNRVTAVRWAHLLKSLGHRVTIAQQYEETPCDVLVALHARRSFEAIQSYRRLYPDGPLIVALTGTDLYRDIRTHRQAQRSLELADRLVVLQPRGRDELPLALRGKVRVLYQSARPTRSQPATNSRVFEVCVLGHLRSEKDPFRTAWALRRIPRDVPIRVTHAGQALRPALAEQARRLMTQEARYRWLGEVPRWRARRLLARSRLLVLSSRMEGGANVISEALADGVPVLASAIPGSIGLLGARYPGFFPVGDTQALADLLRRVVSDARFYTRLKDWCARLSPLVDPARERAAWAKLLDELVPASAEGLRGIG
ncbi:MAG: TIGR04348 family glycosyltransferase [Gemmataceae bacterium]|nr:TIGR04348 family glycosyltransferase [Gemmataceae bacterium]